MLNKLCDAARAVRENSYSPYSGCRVGAALLCDDGSIFTGVNVENASFSPTICAERSAFSSAISAGKRGFSAIAVCGGEKPFPPCGVCRQVMAEFCKPDFPILCISGDNVTRYTLAELLPHAFSGESVK